MPFDKFVDMQSVSEERRKAIHGSLETMSLVDLHQIVKELSDFERDPNRDNLVSAIEAHPEASFYRAITQEGAIIFYCPGDDTGVWFLPSSGMGPLPEEAKRHMREAMAAPPSARKQVRR
jgi:Fe-S-cluster formation regulator IscX/YfhJ